MPEKSEFELLEEEAQIMIAEIEESFGTYFAQIDPIIGNDFLIACHKRDLMLLKKVCIKIYQIYKELR